jgi:hypothetical protein
MLFQEIVEQNKQDMICNATAVNRSSNRNPGSQTFRFENSLLTETKMFAHERVQIKWIRHGFSGNCTLNRRILQCADQTLLHFAVMSAGISAAEEGASSVVLI